MCVLTNFYSILSITILDTSLTKEQITAYFNNLTTGLVNLTIHHDPNQGLFITFV